jgi:hypothetical protein
MPFGQPSGPPASATQVRKLLSLIQQAGHSDFRDARGPMGFTQRQAAGRFTGDEAAELIEQLENSESEDVAPVPTATTTRRRSSLEQAIRAMPSGELAAELQRRGWMVIEP